MPVATPTSLTSNGSNNASSVATASFTPGASRMVYVAIASGIAAATPNAPTLSGLSLTWTQVATRTFQMTNVYRVTLFRTLVGVSPATGAITIDFGGQTQGPISWIVIDAPGLILSGTNGSDSVVQSATNKSDVGSGTASVTLAAFGSTDNATLGVVAITSLAAIAPGSGFTEVDEQANDAVLDINLQVEFKDTNDTSVDATFTSAPWGIIGVELAALVSVGKRRLLMDVG